MPALKRQTPSQCPPEGGVGPELPTKPGSEHWVNYEAWNRYVLMAVGLFAVFLYVGLLYVFLNSSHSYQRATIARSVRGNELQHRSYGARKFQGAERGGGRSTILEALFVESGTRKRTSAVKENPGH